MTRHKYGGNSTRLLDKPHDYAKYSFEEIRLLCRRRNLPCPKTDIAKGFLNGVHEEAIAALVRSDKGWPPQALTDRHRVVHYETNPHQRIEPIAGPRRLLRASRRVEGQVLPKPANNYSRYSSKDIRSIFIARGLPDPYIRDPDPAIWRAAAIFALKQADSRETTAATPRSCDLPSHVRKPVDRQLPAINDESGRGPQIPPAVSCARDEAAVIYYKQQVLDIIIDKQTGEISLATWKYPNTNNLQDLPPCKHIGHLPIMHQLSTHGSTTPFALYFERIRLVLDTAEFAPALATNVSQPPAANGEAPAGRVELEMERFSRLSTRLFAVAALLQECTILKEVEIDVRGCFTEKYRMRVMDAMLPLARLWRKFECKFSGYFPSESQEVRLSELAVTSAQTYAIPIFRKASLLQREMVCFEALNEGTMTSTTVAKYHSAKEEVMTAFRQCFEDVENERKLNICLEFLGTTFNLAYKDIAQFPPGRKAARWQMLVDSFKAAHTARVMGLIDEEGTSHWN